MIKNVHIDPPRGEEPFTLAYDQTGTHINTMGRVVVTQRNTKVAVYDNAVLVIQVKGDGSDEILQRVELP